MFTDPTTNTTAPANEYLERLSGAIPAQMKDARRWLLWRSIPDPKRPKPLKKPFYADGHPRQGTLDTPEDLSRLATFTEVCAAYARDPARWSGLGFALGSDGHHHWQGIDLDKISECPDLAQLASQMPGYIERSPSGDGWHAIGYGQRFKTDKSDALGIECYSTARYFTVTGNDARGEITDLSGFVATTLVPMIRPATKVNGHQRPERNKANSAASDSPFAKVNAKALMNLSAWVPALFGSKAREYHNGYRIASADLGRQLEEDISILPEGIKDFGEETGKTAIDLILDWGAPTNARDAALWLCERMGIAPAAIGLHAPETHAQGKTAPPSGQTPGRSRLRCCLLLSLILPCCPIHCARGFKTSQTGCNAHRTTRLLALWWPCHLWSVASASFSQSVSMIGRLSRTSGAWWSVALA